MAASFRAQVIVPVLSLRTQTLHVHIHVRQYLHHTFTGVLTSLVIVEAEIHHIQLRILPQSLQHRLDGCAAAGHIAVFQPACRIECDVGQQVDGRFKDVEGAIRAILVEAVLRLAALHIDAEHLALTVGAAKMGVPAFSVFVHAHEHTQL